MKLAEQIKRKHRAVTIEKNASVTTIRKEI